MDGLVLLAAGPSRRYGGHLSKVLRRLDGTPVLVRSLAPFLVAVERMALVIVAREHDHRAIHRLLPRARLVAGGDTRMASLARGLEALTASVEIVLVHEAARPLVSADVVRAVLTGARRHGAAAPVLPVRDPLHHVVRNEARGRTTLVDTLDRRGLGATQSPQGARRGLLVAALAAAREGGWEAADEVELLLRAGTEVTAVRGHPHNIRITVPADLDLAEGLLIEAPPD